MKLDLLIRAANVFRGDAPPEVLDVGVLGNEIKVVAPQVSAEQVTRIVDANGLMLCPGFIDMHAHTALASFDDPRLIPKVAQGFTTDLILPDGLAPAPVNDHHWQERRAYLEPLEGSKPEHWTWRELNDYLDALHATHPAITLVPSIGHNAVRQRVMGNAARFATRDEIAKMRLETAKGLEAGARSLSFGLVYLPGVYSNTFELIELAKEAAPYNAPLAVHVRNEGADILNAIDEMVNVSRISGAPLHLSHLKLIGHAELLEALLEKLDQAQHEVSLSFDQYPYTAGNTLLASLLPPWVQEGGHKTTMARLSSTQERKKMLEDLTHGLKGWSNDYLVSGPTRIMVADAGARQSELAGLTLSGIAETWGVAPDVALLDVLLKSELRAVMINHYTTEDVVRGIFKHKLGLVGSDGIFGLRPHPRLYATTARTLGRYALRERLLEVEEVVARLTHRAAKRLGLSDRGRITPGLRADLVLLDPTQFVDTATYTDPCQTPPGVHEVWVAGVSVWQHNQPTGLLPGGVFGR